MNLLSRAFAELLSSPSARQRLILNPVLILHQSSSLYSTTTTSAASSTKPQRKPKHQASTSPPSPSLSSRTSAAHQKNVVSQKEKDKIVSDDENVPSRPSEIPWQAKIVNSVNLIGHVQMQVQSQTSADGKFWAGTVITQQKDFHSPPIWIPIVFEGDLAHIAVCHLKEKDYVHIAGQLNADPPPFKNQGLANVQVMASSINFVEGYSQMNKISAPHKKEDRASDCSASVKNDISAIQYWLDLLAKPHEWWDIRLERGNKAGAAFERKDNGELLWMNESTPVWIQQQLKSLTFDQKIVQESHKTASVKEDENPTLASWRDLVNNPKQWKDYRKHKNSGLVKPKHPDFKHKDGDPLWLNTAPRWVLSALEGLEFDAPIHKTKQVKEHKELGDKSWKDLVENPRKWWDNRSGKIYKNSPDFKHKDTGEGLWLSKSPAWVLSQLPPVKTKEDAIRTRDTLLS